MSRLLARGRVVVALLAVGVSPAAALGQELPPPAASAEPEAVRLYEEGLRHFEVGQYAEAIERLKAAYVRAPLPALLYDLGQAHRLKGDCAEALSFYRRFLASDPPGQRGERTRARIGEMERCVAAAAEATAAPPPSPVPSPPPPAPIAALAAPPPPVAAPLVVTSRPPPDPRRAARRRAGIGAGVAAAALASASGYFAWRAAGASDEVSGVFVPGGRWDGAAAGADRDGITSDRLAIAAGAAALLAAGAAAWLWWK